MHLSTGSVRFETKDTMGGVHRTNEIVMGGDTCNNLPKGIACDHDETAGRSCTATHHSGFPPPCWYNNPLAISTCCLRSRFSLSSFWIRWRKAVIMASFEAEDACSLGGICTCPVGTCCNRRCMIRRLSTSLPYSQAVEIPAVSATVLKLTGRCSFKR